MKALILNSGLGSRMGSLTADRPKCMTALAGGTILSRQLELLEQAGIRDIVITTGAHKNALMEYCRQWEDRLDIAFVHNPFYDSTNYIYSIFLAGELLDDDIILMHGDLVFEASVLDDVLSFEGSCMTVSSDAEPSPKDFKAQIRDGLVEKVSVELGEGALPAQPLYRLTRQEMSRWLQKIGEFCRSEDLSLRRCYAEDALDRIPDKEIFPLDVGSRLCSEIDDPADLRRVAAELERVSRRVVYMCFSTDMIHSGHIKLIRRAARLGRVIAGVLSDEAVSGFKRLPLLPFSERQAMFASITGVSEAVEQRTLSYRENIERYRPDIVVHGDDWREGFQRPIREEVIRALKSYGGRLVEFPYSHDEKYHEIELRSRAEAAMPELRRGSLRRLLAMKPQIRAIEAHSGLTGLIAENTAVIQDGQPRQFDAMWISSLCDSTARGKPDIELVDMTSRLRTLDDIMEVTTKPVIFDGDTGGLTEHFVYTVRTLERVGASMVIIEDKTGLKRNSLFGTEAGQTQAPAEEFCRKISAGKSALKSSELMICARIESLILGKGVGDALERAHAYVEAGADAVMIHSRSSDPGEVLEFADRFRQRDGRTPLVAVPTAYSSVTEEELLSHGINIVIYANQLTRTGFPAMQSAARSILEHHRAKECDEMCMPFGEIIRLIPEDY
ncbi:MAG: phosphoenolpyruvate mutase [Ruminococcus sp.]|nr:phosphoenolpyruvate mutase [Ruminococcus sp.]